MLLKYFKNFAGSLFAKAFRTLKIIDAQKKLLRKIWRPPNQSELTPYQIPSGLTHLGSEVSISNVDIVLSACSVIDMPNIIQS